MLAILHADLVQSKFGIAAPRILVTGLNPHAGENGYLGREEIDVIAPVLDGRATRAGSTRAGRTRPTPCSSRKYLQDADAVLAMYHDQGLSVLKYATFGRGVNITLGLPLIRTSVDHGTALDLAARGLGLADCGSMEEAIRVARVHGARASQPLTSPSLYIKESHETRRPQALRPELPDRRYHVLQRHHRFDRPENQGDTMVEIGPGLAAMTALLLKELGHMHVVELDRDLVARLEKAYTRERLTIHAGDALKFDFGRHPRPRRVKSCAWSATCRTTFRVRCCSTWPISPT